MTSPGLNYSQPAEEKVGGSSSSNLSPTCATVPCSRFTTWSNFVSLKQIADGGLAEVPYHGITPYAP